MKEKLSALMDGELDDKSAADVIQALGSDREAVRAWRTYQLISDAMGESRLLSADFAQRLSTRLAAEPTVLAPRARQAETRKWFALSAAASVAAVALVGWVAFAPPPQTTAPAPVAQVQPEPKPDIVPLPSTANDYLLAHQGFSPRISLQGMAPYARTVAEQAVEPRR
ncbi:MAG TPA: sigma-E factor negative regulatory protein [Burkholderiales bacterium]|jgi:sigma-E factor negative regulatory protein RseA|nr:sigma-E factor negative regulatory protein [Burkholderiales bacterium]